MPLNPNAARDEVNRYSSLSESNQIRSYPQFFTQLKLDTFRHLRNVTLNFKHPISVICGSNRSGKTTTLMAITCSHYNFMRHNVTNGAWERATWGVMMRFTSNDIQTSDWNYYVSYREGSNTHNSVHGYRKQASKKWGGAAKKSKQIGKPTLGHPNGGRIVTLIDLNRITPSRHLSISYYNKAKSASPTDIQNKDKVKEYLSYILQDSYDVKSLAKAADGNVYKYANTYILLIQYSVWRRCVDIPVS